MIDLLYKFAVQNIINDESFKTFVEALKLQSNLFIPNRINNLQYLCYKLDYEGFYKDLDKIIKFLEKKELFIRLLDIYDLRIIADLNTDPTRINKDIESCNENVDFVLRKLKVHDISEISSKTIKTKLSQHYYNLGYISLMIKDYLKAINAFEKSLELDNIFEITSKVLLFNCYDRLNYTEDSYKKYLNISEVKNPSMNKPYIIFKYYEFKYFNKNPRERLKYLKRYIMDELSSEDSILIKVMLYEINMLAKSTSNYSILQEFIEKMGIVD